MKILVIRFSSIGDIVLCSPVLRCLRKRFPDAEIHFLTKKKFTGLLEFNPHINKIHGLEGSISPMLRELKSEKFDLLIDLHSSLRSKFLSLMLGKPALAYQKENFNKSLLVLFKKNRMSGRHVVDRYFDVVKPLGITNDFLGLEFYPCDCEIPGNDEIPPNIQAGQYAVFSIGGTHSTKRMPAAKWIEIAEKMPVPILIAGGREDISEAEKIESGGKSLGKSVFNACGKFSIGGSAHLVKNASLVISHDTGLMHIASAFKKPVVCIWGNTVPAFGMWPYQTANFNMEVSGLSCRPCSRIGFDQCPKKHFNCMNLQDTSQAGLWSFVLDALNPVTV